MNNGLEGKRFDFLYISLIMLLSGSIGSINFIGLGNSKLYIKVDLTMDMLTIS